MIVKYRKAVLFFFGVLSLISLFFLTQLKFTFDFEQFFPQGDDDLEFFRDFTAEFETDDNFLLIGVKNEPDVFDTSFLKTFHQLSLSFKDLPYVTSVQSLTTMRYPVKTPFGLSSIPILHPNDPQKLQNDKKRILSDTRFVHNLINEKATATVAIVKTKDRLSVFESQELMDSINLLFEKKGVADYHMLGRAYFQESIIRIQQKEVMISSVISIALVSLILFIIFRKVKGVLIALTSIAVSLLLFMGLMGALGRPLSIMAALYPVLMLIVGTSDVVHIMSKYVDELNKGKDKINAISTTIKQIGAATFLTSITTSIGFATLLTSRLEPVRDFGLNSAIGVMVAFVTTIFITTSLLSFFDKDEIIDLSNNSSNNWDKLIQGTYDYTLRRPYQIIGIFTVAILLCIVGISKVTTNYTVENNLPRGAKITEDFLFFEEEFSGFRPLEFAITAKNGAMADDYKVVKEINKLEEKLISTSVINSILSQATLYKSVSRMNAGNTVEAYVFPETEEEFLKAKIIIDKMSEAESTILISKNRDKTRISSKIADIGADSIKILGIELDNWVNANIDTSLISVKRTGTGLIIDKNSVYVTESLIKGLGLALIIISFVMALLLKRVKMLILAFIPNFLPVLFAGALLGFFDVELEAGISIVFAVIFGIAVDDTIHFLSKYKLCRMQNLSIEESIHMTFKETGKAILFTTIILFCGFLVMLFSSSPPTQTVGALISVTLVAALLSDILLLPVLMRMWLKD